MEHKATYKTKTAANSDKRSFKYGFFEENLCNCSKCNWNCKKGAISFVGFGNGKSKARVACNRMKIKSVRVGATESLTTGNQPN